MKEEIDKELMEREIMRLAYSHIQFVKANSGVPLEGIYSAIYNLASIQQYILDQDIGLESSD